MTHKELSKFVSDQGGTIVGMAKENSISPFCLVCPDPEKLKAEIEKFGSVEKMLGYYKADGGVLSFLVGQLLKEE